MGQISSGDLHCESSCPPPLSSCGLGWVTGGSVGWSVAQDFGPKPSWSPKEVHPWAPGQLAGTTPEPLGLPSSCWWVKPLAGS